MPTTAKCVTSRHITLKFKVTWLCRLSQLYQLLQMLGHLKHASLMRNLVTLDFEVICQGHAFGSCRIGLPETLNNRNKKNILFASACVVDEIGKVTLKSMKPWISRSFVKATHLAVVVTNYLTHKALKHKQICCMCRSWNMQCHVQDHVKDDFFKITHLAVAGINYLKHKILETKTNSLLQHV